MEEYYVTTQKKVIDFIIGFVGNLAIAALHFGLYWLIFWIFVGVFDDILRFDVDSMAYLFSDIIQGVILVAVEFFLIRFFFKRRRYIAIGMLSSLIVPLLVTGWCSLWFYVGGTSGLV